MEEPVDIPFVGMVAIMRRGVGGNISRSADFLVHVTLTRLRTVRRRT